jgi:UDP-glucose 6-dehydrogenase
MRGQGISQLVMWTNGTTSHEVKKTGPLGLTFKPGTDDLRESPLVNLCEAFIGKGFDLSIYDPNLKLGILLAPTRHISRSKLLPSADCFADHLTSSSPEVKLLFCETP